MQKDHYNPQFLLRAFTVNGELCVFNKETKRIKMKVTPGMICYEPGFTTFDKKEVNKMTLSSDNTKKAYHDILCCLIGNGS